MSTRTVDAADADVIETVAIGHPEPLSLLPALVASTGDIEKNMEAFREFVRGQLREGEDYMVFDERKGGKNNLLKPGAEKMLTYHGFGIEFTLDKESSHEMFDPANPFLRFVYRARVYDKRTGMTILDGVDGEANSYEDRFYATNKPEWELTVDEKERAARGEYVATKRPGKNNREYTFYRVPNPPHAVFAHANTLRKMALKRALVPAAIMACRASGVFTQDLEDMEGFRPARKAPQEETTAQPQRTGPSQESIETVRTLATMLGLNADGLNALCVSINGTPWVSYMEDVQGHRTRSYPCNDEQGKKLGEALRDRLKIQNDKVAGETFAAQHEKTVAAHVQNDLDALLDDAGSHD